VIRVNGSDENYREDDDYYIDDHAVLYGLMAESAYRMLGQAALKTIVVAIKRYCGERGLRSAMRCVADGRELTVRNYILYGEWADTKGWSKHGEPSYSPHYSTRVDVCPWSVAWDRSNLLKYGKIYCQYADKSLVRGFNQKLRIDMGRIITHGGKYCEFNWPACRMTPKENASLPAERVEMIPRVTKGFLYHCAHLLSTFRREFYLEFNLPAGQEIIDRALCWYGETHNPDKAEEIKEESRRNFLEV
jgi:hypothetical protein